MTQIGPNPAEFRTGLRDKLASMPPVGTQGREIKPTAESDAPAVTVPALAVPTGNAGQRMKPNPAQGASSSRTAVTGQVTGDTPLQRIRAIAEPAADLAFDPTL